MKRWIEKGVDWIRNLKYRRKLNLVLILVGLLPVIIIGGYMIYGFRELLGEKEYESMEVSLNQASATIDKQLEIYSNLLNYIVFDRDLQEILDREQTQDYASYSNYVNVVDPILNTPKFYHDSIKKITIFSEDIKIPHDITLAPLADIQGKTGLNNYGRHQTQSGCGRMKTTTRFLQYGVFPDIEQRRHIWVFIVS